VPVERSQQGLVGGKGRQGEGDDALGTKLCKKEGTYLSGGGTPNNLSVRRKKSIHHELGREGWGNNLVLFP